MYDQLLGGGLGPPGPEENGPEPDFVTWLVYLDRAEDQGWLASLAHWWHDEVCRLLLPFVGPAGAAAPAVSLTAFEQDAAGRGRRRRPARWADGLTEECAQLSARWFDVAPTAIASELDVFLARFAGRRHVRLQISVGFEGRSGGLPLVLPALVELARLVGDATDPAYGEIVANAGLLPPATMLDAALGRSAESSAEQCRSRLRGYEWVTLCPRELAATLGGAERLRATGAFAEVRPLRHGGLLLLGHRRSGRLPGRPGTRGLPRPGPGAATRATGCVAHRAARRVVDAVGGARGVGRRPGWARPEPGGPRRSACGAPAASRPAPRPRPRPGTRHPLTSCGCSYRPCWRR
ncbi:hypothetical protein O7626_04650 [Micromonospora sp. WMMD1102]|uniref:hypothetical protein n=1 Tax=Micromonospora sp. WMMD1102 TaxID=3016105 RepID=UPI002415664C|nr:hypothetical protein [Micromonospora sp. WMMD1102]MDG4785228.1 hypothetical protein [Micromonospora sp. WMMD1102]